MPYPGQPQAMKYIRVWVNAGPTTGDPDNFKIKLPRKSSIIELYKMLRLAVDIQIAGSGTKQENGGFWKYQLISHDMKSVINKTSVYLKTDEDYRTLVTIVKDNDKETPVAVLTQEKAQSPDSLKETGDIEPSKCNELDREADSDDFESKFEEPERDDAVWDDSHWEEPVDEDGKPYFDPDDPENFNRVYIKYAEGYNGPLDEEPWMEMLNRQYPATDPAGIGEEQLKD